MTIASDRNTAIAHLSSSPSNSIITFSDGSHHTHPAATGAAAITCMPPPQPSPDRMKLIATSIPWSDYHPNHGEWLLSTLHLEPTDTNNIAELRAVDIAITTIIVHLAATKDYPSLAAAPIIFATDSNYVCNVLDGNWNVRANSAIIDRIRRRIAHLRRRGHPVSFRWIRGHAGIRGNDAVDALANAAALSTSPIDHRRAVQIITNPISPLPRRIDDNPTNPLWSTRSLLIRATIPFLAALSQSCAV
jgi:ribonuclease HI